MKRLALLLSLCAAAPAWAADWRDNRVTPLQRLTVGPSDSFQAAVDAGERRLFFTRYRSQMPKVYRQDLRSADAEPLFAADVDAKDPALQPAGRYLAVTSFRQDAQGDVCLVDLQGEGVRCLTGRDTLDRAPFWIDDGHLGYLSRTVLAEPWQLRVYDLDGERSETLFEGRISSPSASPDGRYIVFSEVERGGRSGLRIFDRHRRRLHTPPPFDLPGISGFTAFSRDGLHLYFTHYLNDTSLDQVIDGNDHSVVFRVPVARLLAEGESIFPEQLTSVAQNCNFPVTTAEHLYLTCAFEGSLDIYRAPLTGTVPSEWDEATLAQAHRSARGHEERLLLLNTLRYRYGHDDSTLLERLLSHHLAIGELSAARHFVGRLEARYRAAGREPLAVFYRNLARLLEVRARKQREPAGVITARFRRSVEAARQAVRGDGAWPRLRWLMEAYLDAALDEQTAARRKLERVPLDEPMLPMERYLAFELYRQLLSADEPARLLGHYPAMFNDLTIERESRLYYAYHYLKLLARLTPDPLERIAAVERQAGAASDAQVAELLKAEAHSLRLAQSADAKAQNENAQQLMGLLKAQGEDPTTRKVLHVRVIDNLAAAERFDLMELLSRHWLINTRVSEVEFLPVAEQYAAITMDKAYGMLTEGRRAEAYPTFYSAIRQTNDLEAHYHFLTLGLDAALGKRENLERSYQLLEKEGILGANREYVAVLRLLAEGRPDDKALAQAAERLQAMRPAGLSPAMRDLLLGYLYHLRLRHTVDGYRHDRRLLQKAHHHYMMALDLGYDNRRIAAGALTNLGWLHLAGLNCGMAADFFARRTELPFESVEREAFTRWGYARALFYCDKAGAAAREAQSALALARQTPLDPQPFIEKAGFYRLQAGQYEQAIAHYRDLLAGEPAGANAAKAHLAHGYALMKLGRRAEASAEFHEVVKKADGLSTAPAGPDRLIAFQPARLRLLAYGFLAQLQTDPARRREYRERRIVLLRGIEGKSGEFAYDEAGRLSLLIKDLHHVAVAYDEAGLAAEVAQTMRRALDMAGRWAEESGSPAGPVIYRTLINTLSFGLLHPHAFRGADGQPLRQRVEAALEAFDAQPYQAPIDVAQRTRLALLWEAYRARVLGQEPQRLGARVEALLTAAEPGLVEAPAEWEALCGIARYLGVAKRCLGG